MYISLGFKYMFLYIHEPPYGDTYRHVHIYGEKDLLSFGNPISNP